MCLPLADAYSSRLALLFLRSLRWLRRFAHYEMRCSTELTAPARVTINRGGIFSLWFFKLSFNIGVNMTSKFTPEQEAKQKEALSIAFKTYLPEAGTNTNHVGFVRLQCKDGISRYLPTLELPDGNLLVVGLNIYG